MPGKSIVKMAGCTKLKTVSPKRSKTQIQGFSHCMHVCMCIDVICLFVVAVFTETCFHFECDVLKLMYIIVSKPKATKDKRKEETH